jgi:hypothetical protein
LADGNLEFLGRVDHQVKVRGCRIELGEVETALRSHQAVEEAVVMAREDQPGAKRLVAYVVPKHHGRPASASELRTHLKQSLPDYMVPAAFTSLEALPLTASGKTDRSGLPAPQAPLDSEYLPPQTPTEEELAGIWCGLLQVERVGRNDNFFDRGGHSLLAARVLARVREAFGVELRLRAVFEVADLEELARRIDHSRRDPVNASVPQIQLKRTKENRPWFLSEQ